MTIENATQDSENSNEPKVNIKDAREFCTDLIEESKTKRAKGSKISLDTSTRGENYTLTSSSTIIKDGKQARKIHTRLKKKNNFVTNKTKNKVRSIGFKEYNKQGFIIKVYTRVEINKINDSKRRELKIYREEFFNPIE